jgi:GAF domain-containing protein
MTRTERSIAPRALMKDRSEARNGLGTSLRKGGGGAHNWGSLGDEARYEEEGLRDEEEEFAEAAREGAAGAFERYLLTDAVLTRGPVP